MKKIIPFLWALAVMQLPLGAQEEHLDNLQDPRQMSSAYVTPSDPAVLQKLDEWQDRKFGMLIHWGLYSIPGIVESWSICNEDWITRPEGSVYEDYKKWYWDLSKLFNPVQFDPDQWAQTAEEAGMQYAIFTTKHHDGYCLFDSRHTDFKISAGPFRNHPKANAAYYVFEAFRKRNFLTGAYFSKPDWHHPGFWNPYYATPDRHPNYRRDMHPDWWQSYVDYTAGQLREILTDYGHLDILWLDGGWIAADEFGIDGILQDARSRYPGLICVDRAIGGPNENYRTPERGVPETRLHIPWETCIPHSSDWGWTPNARYRSWQNIINTLIEVTAKGGCLVLGVGPTAGGLIEEREIGILQDVGKWLKKNGKAIYSTRAVDPYAAPQPDGAGSLWFTGSKDGRTVYALYAAPEEEPLPRTLVWSGNTPAGRMTLLNTGQTVQYSVKNGVVTVLLPRNLPAEPLALSFLVK